MWGLLAALVAGCVMVASHGQQEKLCPKPVLLSDVQMSPTGVDVSLTCQDGPSEENATFTWKLENRTLSSRPPNRVIAGSKILLKSARYRDSGNYSCYRNGAKFRNIRLLVGESLETPQISCSRKFPVGHIRCEWQPSYKPSATTKAVLVVHRGITSQPTREFCSYYPSMQRFTCRLPLAEGDHTNHLLFLCVTSMADSRFSKAQLISGYTVLKPDPPVNVTVRAVEGAPRKLSVTWQYPPTWNPSFYKLQFQVKYRVEHTTHANLARVEMNPSFLIVDALMGRRHVVQVRAQEEFSHGSWSHWSLEVTGDPWTDSVQEKTESPQTTLPQDYSTEDMRSYPDKYYNYGDSDYVQTDVSGRPPGSVGLEYSHISQYSYFIAGACLALGIILFIGVLIRYKLKWQQEIQKGRKLQNMFSFCSLRKENRKEPKRSSNSMPLVSPPTSPVSNAPTDDGEDTVVTRTYDVTNLNYFFTCQ